MHSSTTTSSSMAVSRPNRNATRFFTAQQQTALPEQTHAKKSAPGSSHILAKEAGGEQCAWPARDADLAVGSLARAASLGKRAGPQTRGAIASSHSAAEPLTPGVARPPGL